MKQTQNTNAIATAILEVLPDTPNAALLAILDKLDPIPPEIDRMSDGELLAALEGVESDIAAALSRLRDADYDDGNHPAVSDQMVALHAVELAARAVIAKAKGENK